MVTLIVTSDKVMNLLPCITWNALREKITILETALEAIGVLVMGLLNICNGLDR